MTLGALQSLSPLIVLSVMAVVTMLAIGYRRHLGLTTVLSLIGLAGALAALPIAQASVSPAVDALLIMDRFAIFYCGLIFSACFVVVVLSHGYMKQRIGEREEFFLLLVLATLGAAVIAASAHFASFFLGLEILSISLYGLIAYPRLRVWSVEAGMKYLVLASASAAFLLLGMALIYTELGTMEFEAIAELAARGPVDSLFLVSGTILIVAGIGFKLAVVPFHMWTPDVYEGAPAPATALIATVSKGAVVALLLRFFAPTEAELQGALFLVFSIMALASMVVGNLLALQQNNVKRMLAYSSIAHLGYVLVAFLAGGAAIASVSFYLAAYFVTTLAAFGVVTALSPAERDADNIEGYRGLASSHPLLACTLAVALLSLAGIPLTAGFLGKFYVALVGVGAALFPHVITLVVGSTIGFYYYLRLALIMFLPAPPGRPVAPSQSRARPTVITLALLAVLVLFLGLYPNPLVDLVQSLSPSLPR